MGAWTDLSNGLTAAVQKAEKGVVQVDARRRYPASGIALAPDLVLTADHVVTKEANLVVRTAEGRSLSAVIAGRDPGSDLAVLRLSEKVLAPSAVGKSAARVGQLVLALGRPSEAGVQASWGIVTSVSGPARTHRGGLLERYLTTETTPYPGFSGGPLVDTDGMVLGLNTSGLTPGSALTIPTEVAWPIGETLAKEGHLRRGYLGVRTQPVEPADPQDVSSGLLVTWLEDGGPAASAGLLVGDILTSINGRPVKDPDDIFGALTSSTVGRAAELGILRGGKPQTVQVTVGERH